MHDVILWTDSHGCAQRIGWTDSHLRRVRSRGLGPPYLKLGPRTIRYRVADIEAWIDAHRVETGGR